VKRAIFLEAFEVETVAGALENHAAANITEYHVVTVGRRELRRLAKKFRDTLAPKPAPKVKP